MHQQAKPFCSMSSSELSKASHDHLAFTERLLESVRARRDTDAKEAAGLTSCAVHSTAAERSPQQHSMLAWVFQFEQM
jgi:hypothetical protein